jgi:flagellar FliL protein
MANDAQETVAQAPVVKKKKGLLIVAIAVVLLLLAGGGYALLGHRNDGDKTAKAAPAQALPEQYLALDPAFVVNFRDDQSVRFLQVGVTLMAHDAAALEAAKDAQPVVRNALVMLFSNQSYAGLSDAAGKEKLQAQALAAVQKIVSERTGKPGIDALYFTSFVMQ